MKKRIFSFLLTIVMVISILPTMVFAGGEYFNISNGTAEVDKETNHGYITIDKTSAQAGDTVSITVKPEDGYQLKSMTVVPEEPTINYIADILATIDGFPEGSATDKTVPPDSAWVCGNNKFAYTVYNGAVGALVITNKDESDSLELATTTEVTAGDNCYIAVNGNNKYTFNMANGTLTGIVFSSTTPKSQDNFGGTYEPKSTAPSPNLTPVKQDDGTYIFTMPKANVEVTADFEEIPGVTIGNLIATVAGGFPTTAENGWVNENGAKSYSDGQDIIFARGSSITVPLSFKAEKSGNNYVYQSAGYRLTFVMSDNVLEKVILSDVAAWFSAANGTYAPAHVHSFSYTASNGKLTATCTDGCTEGYDTTPLTLTLTAPTNLAYDGNPKSITFADGEATAWTGAGLDLPTVTYAAKSGSSLTNDKAVDAGSYTASITVDTNKTANLEFEITKVTPYIKSNPAPSDIIYGKTLADSTLAGGYVQVSSTDSTQIAGLFEWSEPNTVPAITDSDVTLYSVTFTPADEKNYNVVSCKVTITVNHTHNPVIVDGQPATVTASGWKDYYECACGDLFEDANGTTPIENLDTWKAEGGNGYIPPLAPKSYTVTFNMNGHGTQIASQTVESGSKATKPADPTASGWTFGGWYTDATFNAAFSFDTAITTDTTIYAKWTEVPTPPVSYTVTFDMGGHGTQIASQTVESGSKATKPADPTASGWTFGGWYTDATYKVTFDFDTAITTDTTIYAKWTEVPTPPVSYTVTFDMGGHGTQIPAQTVESGSKATKPADPTASGWTFGGWYTDATFNAAFSFDTAITTNTTVYAKWTETTYDFEDDDTLIWQLGSNETLNFVVHRSVDDSETFGLFVGIQVDGIDVSAENYDAASGSLILNLKPSYLNTLAAGRHTLKVIFKDGMVSINFEVEPVNPTPTATPKPDGNLPQTGEANSWTAIGGILLIAIAAVFVSVSARKRREI